MKSTVKLIGFFIVVLSLAVISGIWVPREVHAGVNCMNCYAFNLPLPGGGSEPAAVCLSLSDTGFQNCLQGQYGCVVDSPCGTGGAPPPEL